MSFALGLWAVRHGWGRTSPGRTWLNCGCGAAPWWIKHTTNPDGSINQKVSCDLCLEEEYEEAIEDAEEDAQDADTKPIVWPEP